MAHDHHHLPQREPSEPAADRRTTPLVITLAPVTGYMALEFIGGLLSGSLALLADAGHMLSDAGALGPNLFAKRLARRPRRPTGRSAADPRSRRLGNGPRR